MTAASAARTDERDRYDIVIPTIARPSLHVLLAGLAGTAGPPPERIYVVDDRRADGYHFASLGFSELPARFVEGIVVLRSHGMGPGFARNVGWSAGRSPWVAFLDDDVVVGRDWSEALARDLASIESEPDAERVAGSYARIVVPLPADRAPTDWERNVAGLATACWITADAVFRRSALVAVEGFDPRFPRAFREDTDLALRLERAGYRLARGTRTTRHPVRPASRWVSVTLQRGNADDALMSAIHGAHWHDEAGAEPGRYAQHVRVVAAALAAVRAALEGRSDEALRRAAAWAIGTALFAFERIAPGPRTPAEIATMVATSIAIPFAAVRHRLRGERAAAGLVRSRVRAVLFDRDGTLVHDAPIGANPRRVVAMPGAATALARLREARVKIGVVTNQPAIARGDVTRSDLDRVHARIVELVGPIDAWAVCDHAEEAGCACRKPAPALIERAARDLGVTPAETAVIGDIGSDMDAALAAGARAILVPTAATRASEIDRAPHVVSSLERAVDLVLGGRL